MADELSYPVIVTYTETHVVWVQADTHEDAVAMLEDAPYEWTSSHTAVDGGGDVAAPDGYDWHLAGLRADAHVDAYHRHQHDAKRAVEKAACAAKGHPSAELQRDRVWCPVCWSLPLTTLAVSDVL